MFFEKKKLRENNLYKKKKKNWNFNTIFYWPKIVFFYTFFFSDIVKQKKKIQKIFITLNFHWNKQKPKYRNTYACFNILNKILKDYFELDMDYSQLGHILQKIKVLVAGLCKGSFSCVRRSGNSVAHSLANLQNLSLRV